MAFLAVFSCDSRLRATARVALESGHRVATTASWERLLNLVRERPITAVVLDEGALGPAHGPLGALATLRGRFPGLATVLVARPDTDPRTLLRLGRTESASLVLVRVDDLAHAFPRAVGDALKHGTEATVTRCVSPFLARRQLSAVRTALEGAVMGWSAEDVAGVMGLTRQPLSVLLAAAGLPPVGHLLLWGKMLHAGQWLEDTGRSGQSISRQLDYSSGAAFRRALMNYTGRTPTAVRESGGLSFVLDRFLTNCSLSRAGVPRSAA